MLRKSADLRSDLEGEYQELIGRARRLGRAVDADRFNRRPSPDAWSAAECVDHLNTTARLYLEPLDEAIRDARSRGLTDRRPDGRTLLGRIIAWAMEPPPRLRMKTQEELEPAPDHDPEALIDDFATLHGRLVAQLDDASDLDGKRVKVRSLLDSRLKLSLDDWYAFLAAHARRHLWQAEQALDDIDRH